MSSVSSRSDEKAKQELCYSSSSRVVYRQQTDDNSDVSDESDFFNLFYEGENNKTIRIGNGQGSLAQHNLYQ